MESSTKQRARLGGLARSAAYDGQVVTAAARQAAHERFREQAERDAAARGEQLTETELERRAAALRKLHFARMAFRSVISRSKKKAAASTSFSRGLGTKEASGNATDAA